MFLTKSPKPQDHSAEPTPGLVPAQQDAPRGPGHRHWPRPATRAPISAKCRARDLLRCLWLLLFAVQLSAPVCGQAVYSWPYTFTTLAGDAGYGSTDGTGSGGRFLNPSGVATDSAGNTYVADATNQTIRKVTPAGAVTTLAGLAGSQGSADGTGSAARFANPASVAVDGTGNVYVADYSNHTIRKVTAAGAVTTLAGLAGVSGSTDATGSAARFANPTGVAVDGAGNVYVADQSNNTLRKVTAAGEVTTLAGLAGVDGSTDGTGSAARFYSPAGVAVDSSGTLYVADTYNNTIRQVTPAGVVTTLAGLAGGLGSTDGTGGDALFFYPESVAVDASGNVYVADAYNNTIRKVTPAGVVTTLAGLAESPGSADGTGSAARFNNPTGVAVDSTGNLRVADQANNTVRYVTAAGVVTTLAGVAGMGSADGTGSAARFYNPGGVTADSAGNLYVADANNNTIRKITPAGVVTTLAGLAGTSGSDDATGGDARFNDPSGVAVDNTGNVYVADFANHTIRKITAAGEVATLAGLAGTAGSDNGTGGAARFNYPAAVAVDSAGNVYVADMGNHTIRKVTPAGVVTTLAGLAGAHGTTDATGAAARFNQPQGLAVDSAGTLYVADTSNSTIRKVTAAGVVTTLAGRAGSSGSADRTGGLARFNSPTGVAVDSTGNVYVADYNNSTLRQVTPAGGVTTIAGLRFSPGNADGTGTAAKFNYPLGIALDSAGNAYVADTFNNTIRKGTPPVLYTVTPDAGANGSISPATPRTVVSGANVTFSATPATAYLVDQWLLDGAVAQTGGNSFTLTSLGASHALQVTFKEQAVYPTPYTFSPLAGWALLGCMDGTLATAGFNGPAGLATDSAGNIYMTDSGNQVIRKITASGVVTTLAGLAGSPGSADGTGSAARFHDPAGLAVDGAGNVYVADSTNHTIRKITPAGVVTTLAGLAGVHGSANGTGGDARFYNPVGVAVDAAGKVYVADSNNNSIRKITPAGVVTSLAGGPGSADGTGSAAGFNFPIGLAVDGAGNIYVADTYNHTLRLVTPTGVVTTLAGLASSSGSADGTGSDARFEYPVGMVIGGDGNLSVTDNNTIRTVTPAGVVTTRSGSPGDARTVDGTGGDVRFASPGALAFDSAGNLYVADGYNSLIRKLTPAGVATTPAGSASADSTDGSGSAARFNNPVALAVDTAGNVYVADFYNNTIRKVTSAGATTTLAGLAGSAGSTDATGSDARFATPAGVAVDSAGNLYVTDSGNSTIRLISPTGVVTTLAGLAGSSGGADGTGSAARFNAPMSISGDGAGNLFVADTGNNTIRMITPAGVVTTLGGFAGTAGSADGTGKVAQFSAPSGVAVDGTGNLYVADTGNNTIRKGSYMLTTPTLTLSAPGVSGGSFGFGISGPDATAVEVETSADLSNWSAVGSCVLVGGINSFVSPMPASGSQFFRAHVR